MTLTGLASASCELIGNDSKSSEAQRSSVADAQRIPLQISAENAVTWR